MRIYVASSWRNEHQQYVVEALRKAGHEVYDFKHPVPGNTGFHWGEIDPNWESWTTQQYRDALKHEYARFGFNRDFDAMKAGDACVLVLPCGRSAHLEAGWMKGAGKKVFAYIPSDCRIEPELMYKMLDGIASDIQEILTWLTKPRYANDCKWYNQLSGMCDNPKKDRSKKSAIIAGREVDTTWDGRCIDKTTAEEVFNGRCHPPLACDQAEIANTGRRSEKREDRRET